MVLILKIGVAIFNAIYFFLKLLPSKNKVLFLSRQSNAPSRDFLLLSRKTRELHPDFRTVVLCRKIEGNMFNKIGYCFHMLRQAYHLATAKIVVLDSYSILVSCLHHKPNLLIIQIWHSIGTMKKFGYSILDKPEGSSSSMARAMHMHENYDYVLSASAAYKAHLAEGFNVDINKIVTLPLPRVELLKSPEYKKSISRQIFAKYPQLNNGKKNVVYCPTFRKENLEEFRTAVKELISCINKEEYNLILKLHPLSQIDFTIDGVLNDSEFSTFDMLFISDGVISDYSCIIYEAAVLNKPLYFYDYDYDEYMSKRDIYIDYKAEIPGEICKTADAIARVLQEPYDLAELKKFANKYVELSGTSETIDIVNFIFNQM